MTEGEQWFKNEFRQTVVPNGRGGGRFPTEREVEAAWIAERDRRDREARRTKKHAPAPSERNWATKRLPPDEVALYREIARIEARLDADARLIDTKRSQGLRSELRDILRAVERRRAWHKLDSVDRQLEELLAESVEPHYELVRRNEPEVKGDNQRIRNMLGTQDEHPGAIVEQGPSGRAAGRPKPSYGKRIAETLTRDGSTLEGWRAAFAPGRPSRQRRALRVALAPLIRELREPRAVYGGKRKAVPKAAIARVLKCDRKAIDDLFRQNPPH
jgi:hypothetical protein